MKKRIILIIMMIFLVLMAFARAGELAGMEVHVENALPGILDVTFLPDDSIEAGTQIYKDGTKKAGINVTLNDTNGLEMIEANAYIEGPSIIEESPLNLINILNISLDTGIYSGDFLLDNSDEAGTYTVNVSVTDQTDTVDYLTTFRYEAVAQIRHVGTGQTYATIQEAINDSNTGDIIYVHDGSYNFSDNLGADFRGRNSLKLMGESKEGVVLEGNQYGTGIVLMDNENIQIEKMTISNGYHGIFIENSTNISVKDIIVANSTWEGIRVDISSGVEILLRFRHTIS